VIARAGVRAALAAAALIAVALTSLAAADRLMPGDQALADALQATPGGHALEAAADVLALRGIEYAAALSASALALARRRYAIAAAVLGVIFAGQFNPTVKELIGRARPAAADVVLREPAPGYGYPSGHVWSATLLYGYAAVSALRAAPGRAGAFVAAAAATATLLIAWDRVWDGAHWPSDAVGSAALCLLLLAACFAGADVVARGVAGRRGGRDEAEAARRP